MFKRILATALLMASALVFAPRPAEAASYYDFWTGWKRSTSCTSAQGTMSYEIRLLNRQYNDADRSVDVLAVGWRNPSAQLRGGEPSYVRAAVLGTWGPWAFVDTPRSFSGTKYVSSPVTAPRGQVKAVGQLYSTMANGQVCYFGANFTY